MGVCSLCGGSTFLGHSPGQCAQCPICCVDLVIRPRSDECKIWHRGTALYEHSACPRCHATFTPYGQPTRPVDVDLHIRMMALIAGR